LLSEPALEPAIVVERPRQTTVDPGGRLRGRASGRHRTTGGAIELLYMVVDLGAETVIARFVGPAEQVAFNRGVLQAALRSMEVEALISGSLPDVTALTWETGQFLDPDGPSVTLPSGWHTQLTSGVVCSGLAPAVRILSASPPEDFTVSLRLAWWPVGSVEAKQVASACGGGLTDRPFVQRAMWAGVPYITEGSVRTAERGVVILGVNAPGERLAASRAIFEAWARSLLR
jgi:hypothetical protein